MKTDEELLFGDAALFTKEELLRRRALIAKHMEEYRQLKWTEEDEKFMDTVVAALEAEKATKQ